MRIMLLAIFLFFICTAHAQELYIMPKGNPTSHMSSFENLNGVKGQGGISNQSAKGNAFESLPAGKSKTLLNIKGAGTIQRMWFTVRNREPKQLRSLRLQIFWDNAAKPAVDVPFGDFFSVGLGRTTIFESALFSSPEGRSFNCYIPMPFKNAARVVLNNEGAVDEMLLFYDIDFIRVNAQPADMLYFHAYWHRQKSSAIGACFDVLPNITGKGRYLGANIGVNADTSYRGSWFGEGEVKMYIDDDTKYPTINGTGTEDYIGTGWGQGVFINRYQGCTIADEAKQQYCFYRFHIPDQVFFYKNFKASIQQIGGADLEMVRGFLKNGARLQPITVANDATGFVRLFEGNHPAIMDADFPKGWVNFYRSDDYSATAYFYLDKPQNNLPALAPVAERIN
jgi:hypothetical protein